MVQQWYQSNILGLCIARILPVLTFLKLEFFLNEHGVVPTSLSQPNVGISAQSEPVDHPRWLRLPHKQKSFRIDCSPMPSVCCPHHRCQVGLSAAQGQDSLGLGPRFHELATPHHNTSHCGFSRGEASSKVCITKHFNIAVQLGPWTSAGHSRVFDCVSFDSLEGREVLCTC